VFDIEVTDEFRDWYRNLEEPDADAVSARVELLAEVDPNLKRPVVGEITTSRFAPRMKELRCGTTGAIRVLFCFDPRRTAVLLLGGAKAGQWDEWYEQAIPQADRLYEVYLDELMKEGLL
jgi:hypothetical protein